MLINVFKISFHLDQRQECNHYKLDPNGDQEHFILLQSVYHHLHHMERYGDGDSEKWGILAQGSSTNWYIYYADEIGLEFIIDQFNDKRHQKGQYDRVRSILKKELRSSKLDLLC